MKTPPGGDKLKYDHEEYPMPVRTLAVDFDATIHRYDGWKGDETFNEPLDLHAMNAELDELRKSGWKIIVWTCRGDLAGVESFLKKYQIPYDAINHNPWAPENIIDCRKIVATAYLDDRNITFEGKWKGMAQTVKNFSPWYQESAKAGE